LRTKSRSPYFARFKVPIDFSKLDMRDYLFHAYNVRAVSIRSAIKQQPLQLLDIKMRRIYERPPSEKYMTVEMTQPFVWPAEPEDLSPWNPESYKESEEQQKLRQEHPEAVAKDRARQFRATRTQARDMLLGKEVGLSAWEKKRTHKIITSEEPKFKVKI
jgi:large subunit ribosomal protein L23